MICPWCSEEHPVTEERCPLTGKPLRAPVEAAPAREERASFGSLLAEAARLYRRNLFVVVMTGCIALAPFAALGLWTGTRLAPSPQMQRAMRTSPRLSPKRRKPSAHDTVDL